MRHARLWGKINIQGLNKGVDSGRQLFGPLFCQMIPIVSHVIGIVVVSHFVFVH